MIISRHNFEFNFSASALQAGLRLLKRGELHGENKTSVAKRAFSAGDASVQVQEVQTNQLRLSCTCRRQYCEHMAAVLLHLEAVNYSEIRRQTGNRPPRKQNRFLLAAEKFEKELRLVSGLRDAVDKLEEFRGTEKDRFLFALVVATSPRLAVLSAPAKEVIAAEKEFLSRRLSRPLNQEKFDLLAEAALASVKSQQALTTSAFSLLLPPFISGVKDRTQLALLAEKLSRRKRKMSFHEKLDLYKVCSLMLEMRLERFPRKTSSTSDAEHIIAGALLLLHRQKQTGAFKLLTNAFENLREHQPAQVLAYIDWSLKSSQLWHQKEARLFFLTKKALYALSISAEDLAEIRKLSGRRKFAELLPVLLAELSDHHNEFGESKIILLLRQAGMWHELAGFLKNRTGHYFDLLASAHGLLPEFPDFLPLSFAKNLRAELEKVKNGVSRQKILLGMLGYYRLLGKNEQKLLLDAVFAQAGFRSSLAQEIEQMLVFKHKDGL